MRQRHALYLSQAMTRQLAMTAAAHHLPKSQILETALERYLSPANGPSANDGPNRHQEPSARSLRRLERDLAINSELLATFIRYFLMITPPLPEGEHAAARALGQLRLDAVIQDVARRLRTDRSLMARVSAVLREHQQQTVTDGTQPDANNALPASEPVSSGPDGTPGG